MKKTFQKWKLFSIVILLLGFLAACNNQDGDHEGFTLKNQENEDVTINGDKPALIFFFTTYT